MSGLSDKLLLCVTDRFIAMGMPEESARSVAAVATANFLNGRRDHFYDMVASETLGILSETVPTVLSNLVVTWNAMRPALTQIQDFVQASATSPDQFTWSPTDMSPEEEAALDKEHPSDFISGAPDHYLVNGSIDSCGCPDHRFGHHSDCQLWDDSDWAHSTTLCVIPRTNCLHPERHPYGQKCANYYADDEATVLPEGTPQVVTPKAVPFFQPHLDSCSPQGGHKSGDCLNPRPTCPHTPSHPYAERCPR